MTLDQALLPQPAIPDRLHLRSGRPGRGACLVERPGRVGPSLGGRRAPRDTERGNDASGAVRPVAA